MYAGSVLIEHLKGSFFRRKIDRDVDLLFFIDYIFESEMVKKR